MTVTITFAATDQVVMADPVTIGVDATGTALIGPSSVSSISYTGITVGSSLRNGALIAFLALGATKTSSGLAAVWDSGGSNQAMKLIGSVNTSTSGTIAIFGLRNPTAGNKTLALSWTGANYPVVCALSLSGVEPSSDTNAFQHFTSTSGSGNLSLNVMSAVGDMVVGLYGIVNAISAVGNTVIYTDTTSSGLDSGAERAAGATSVTISGTGTGASALCGVNIAAAGASSTYGYFRSKPRPLLRR